MQYFKEYNNFSPEDQNKQTLTQNQDFINDAYYFLVDREGYKQSDLNTPEKVYDQFLEHFRYQNVNEVTAIRDLEYAQNASISEKENFARLIALYDKMEGDSFNVETAKDYAGGIFTSPSTYIGLLTGGAGKLASVGGNQLTKLGIRKLLTKEIAKSAGKGAVVEGSIGAVQAGAQEGTKVEVGLKDEVDTSKVIGTALISAGGGAILNAGAGAYQTMKAIKADEFLTASEVATKKLADDASKKSKAFLKGVREGEDTQFLNKILEELSPETYKMTSDGLKRIAKKQPIAKKPLDAEKVSVGRDLAKEKGLDKLPIEFFENLSAAVLKVKNKIKIGKDQRVTSAIADAIGDEKISFKELSDILREHNLSYDQFSLVYLADISDAGRTLGYHGFLKNQLNPSTSQKTVAKLLTDIQDLERRGLTRIDKTKALEVLKNKKDKGVLRDLDRLRLALMTSQPATTMRNNANALFRVVVDAGTRTFYNVLKGRISNPFDGTFDIAKYMLNPYEAQAVRNIFQNTMPDSATVLFREAADLTSQTGGGALAKIGTKANFLNTMSDNFFKQAVFTASLRRRLADDGQDLVNIIKNGKFNTINKDIIEGSMQDALEFVYQKSFKGDGWFSKVAKGTIDAHRNVPFVISSFIPFPRFIANQMKFLYEHTPLLGLMNLEGLGTKQGYIQSLKNISKDEYQQKFAKQLTGLMMFSVAYNWRKENMDDDGKLGTYWYEFKDDTGKVVDGRPTYGPFAPYLLAADIALRYQLSDERGKKVKLNETNFYSPVTGLWEDLYDRWGADGKRMTEVMNSPRQYMQDALQSLFGSSFRTGYGYWVIDKLFDDVAAGGEGVIDKAAAEFGANLINTYTMPMAVLKDVYSQFDKFARYIPETRQGDPKGDISFYKILFDRGTRAFPDIGANTIVGRYYNARRGAKDIAEKIGFDTVSYDTPYRNPLRTGDQIAFNPLEKQMFGLGKMPRKNVLEREMADLNLQYYDFYRKSPNAFIDRKLREVLSGEESVKNLNEVLEQVILRDELYLNLKSKAQKRNYLVTALRERVMPKARDKALKLVELERERLSSSEEDSLPYSLVQLNEYRSIPSPEKDSINAEFRNGLRDGLFEIEGFENLTEKEIEELNIENSRDLTIILKGVRTSENVLRWAISRKGVAKGRMKRGIMGRK
jgi:hypothetical protein